MEFTLSQSSLPRVFVASPSSSNSFLSYLNSACTSCYTIALHASEAQKLGSCSFTSSKKTKLIPLPPLCRQLAITHSVQLAGIPGENIKWASATSCDIFGWISLLIVLPYEVRLHLIPGWVLPLEKENKNI